MSSSLLVRFLSVLPLPRLRGGGRQANCVSQLRSVLDPLVLSSFEIGVSYVAALHLRQASQMSTHMRMNQLEKKSEIFLAL